jgi:hypothetical protein
VAWRQARLVLMRAQAMAVLSDREGEVDRIKTYSRTRVPAMRAGFVVPSRHAL